MLTSPGKLRFNSVPHALARRAWLYLFVLVATSCAPSSDQDAAPSPAPPIGKVAQALTDTDADGLDDDWEQTFFGSLSQTAAGDYDSDGMSNLEEYQYGFNPTVDDAFDDGDGDRYPNVFEVRNGSDPTLAGSTPTASATVNGSGGGTHTTVGAALSAVNGQSNSYPIIAIAAGTYTGSSNSHPFSFNGSGKRYLVIGLAGAANTIIDGGGTNYEFDLYNKAVIASVTIKRTLCAVWVSSSAGEIHLNDVILRDNGGSSYAAAVDFSSTKLYITGSTLLDNVGTSSSKERIYVGSGTATITNTVVQGISANPMLVKATSATLVTNYSLVKG